MTIDLLPLSSSLPFYYSGEGLEKGPLPAYLYLGSSAKASLTEEPFCGPMSTFAKTPIRIISSDLPFHKEPPFDQAIEQWFQELQAGRDFLTPFIDQVIQAIEECIEKEIVDPKRIAIGGLSRGGWIALLVAMKKPIFSHMLSFAPLIDPLFLQGWKSLKHHSFLSSWNPFTHLDELHHMHIRFYIGNHDMRVGTSVTFSFIEALTAYAFAKQQRSLPFEMILTPSIGYLGHGTPKSSFTDGAKWLLEQWRVFA